MRNSLIISMIFYSRSETISDVLKLKKISVKVPKINKIRILKIIS